MTVETKKSKKMYWMLCVGSLILMAFLLLFVPELFWISLPGALTGLAGGMDWI